ncbi:phosphatidate cytidylyltransferase [Bombilactobacillus bombi]|uniref:Phosphatidate cytidylyltransferase n=1 Tax=Bombilactobacillus bombi TaxID=1303590 RepID=A0A347SQR7_9LACO|nr:phosphatidate cytidylyltransferase [Bombilactobacillus bombi]AXX64376.1 phosphatidate cytidylyltransferase [Bombilactobacillus bombi]RHW49674.1 phosphatidate cytidylyltransferase [Bombilactobacillus bombi]
MKKRVITAIVALAIFIPIIIAGGVWIDITASVLAIVGLSEIYIMRKRIIVSLDFFIGAIGVLLLSLPENALRWLPSDFSRFDLAYVFVALLLVLMVFTKNNYNFEDAGTTILSMFYIGNGFHYLAAIRNSDSGGLSLLLFGMIIVWVTDSGAYLVGRKLGKHKLYPAISPNKTWEGSIGGVLAAIIFALIYMIGFNQFRNITTMSQSVPMLIILTIILSVAGQIGDLVESAYKRFYGVKDSGKILPGHGGILDRFDSMLFVLPLIHALGFI